MTTVAIHQPQYLPWIPYLAKAASCDIFVYLDNVEFQKNGVQNRNQVKAANGPAWLTVPVRASLQTNIQDTPIDNSQPWRQKHLKTIENAYARATYKSLIDEGLRQLLMSEWNYLSDLNIALTDWMFNRLDIHCKRVRASDLQSGGVKDDLVIDICRAVGADVYLSGQGARAYQDESKFNQVGIRLIYQQYEKKIYHQCFPKLGFVPSMSGLDLILNMGDQSRRFL